MTENIVRTNPNTMAKPGGHYTHAVTANGFVFIAGQLPITPDGTKLIDAPFEHQARQALDNVAAALAAAGSAVEQLVQVRVYVTDMKEGRVSTRFTPAGLVRHVQPAPSCPFPNCTMASKLRLRPLLSTNLREKVRHFPRTLTLQPPIRRNYRTLSTLAIAP